MVISQAVMHYNAHMTTMHKEHLEHFEDFNYEDERGTFYRYLAQR